MSTSTRILLADPDDARASRLAAELSRSGQLVVRIRSVSEASSLEDTFDEGLFAFDMADGSGIVLAASLMADERLRSVEFVHPHDDCVDRSTRQQKCSSIAGATRAPGTRRVA